jgi:hypothetical protein
MTVVYVSYCKRCDIEHAETYPVGAVIVAGGRICTTCGDALNIQRLRYIWSQAFKVSSGKPDGTQRLK